MSWKILLVVVCLLSVFVHASFAQQRAGSLRGQVTDELGALVVGATVTLVAADGTQMNATTNNEGVYTFSGVATGAYTLRIVSPGFTPYEKNDLAIADTAAESASGSSGSTSRS